MDAVVAEGVVKRYGDVEALKGVHLRVKSGETFGLLGPNGAGKSTLMQILCTMLRPTEGDARIAGHSVTHAPDAVRRELGVVFQQPTLDGVMNAHENLWIHGRLYGVPRAQLKERIPELIRLVGLTERANDRVGTYSGGMKRRLEIARAVLHRPNVLLLDEPTVALDPQSRKLLWEHIVELKKTYGTTILVTTHYMEEADALCDRIAIIDHGEVLVLDSPDSLKRTLGGDRLELRLDGPLNGGGDALRKIPNVQSVTAEGDTVRVLIREPQTTIPQVVHAVGAHGVRVVELKHQAASLNDVFMEHTGHAPRESRKKPTKGGWLKRMIKGV